MRMSRDVMINGAGAGVGVVWTVLSKQYIDTQFGPIPFIGGMLPHPWGNWSTLGSILMGGIFFGVSQFTGVIKNSSLNNFLTYFGLTTLIGGIMNGLFYGGTVARARAAGIRVAPRASSAVTNLTPTGVPYAKVLS